MKPALAWLKKHWAIIVLGVVALAALPAALYFSTKMSKDLREEVKQKVEEEHNAVTRNNVTYYLQTADGTRTLEKSTVVNREWTKFYKELNEKEAAASRALVEKGEAFNRANHDLLVEGLFPKPPDLEAASKRTQFLDIYINRYHQRLLESIGAGTPPAPADMLSEMNQVVEAERARVMDERGSPELLPDEQARLQATLYALRLEKTQQRAREIGVYADVGVFGGLSAVQPLAQYELPVLWDLQERAWIHGDVVRAIGKVNGGSEGGEGVAKPAGGVPESIVKRIVKIAATQAPYETGSAAVYDPGLDKAPPNYGRSPTGRISGPGSQNKWYDIREVEVEVIVSSQRLPAFIDALAQTNFVSVLDLDIQAVDVFEELRAGYYYGDENVVRAKMRLESIYLRSWREAGMPQKVKLALGMVDPNVDPSAAVPDANTPPAAPPTRGIDRDSRPGRRGEDLPGEG